MKKGFFGFIFLFSSYSSFSQVSFGSGLSYDVLANLGIKILVTSDVADEWKGQVSYTYFFGDWALDFDAHYKFIEFDIGYDGGYLTPFSGLNINRDIDMNDTELGINLGLNLILSIEELSLFLEPKITIGGTGGLIISAGVIF
ncbi:MAG: hypothetical protein V3V00_01050 [Saprospiraceae bacterium]